MATGKIVLEFADNMVAVNGMINNVFTTFTRAESKWHAEVEIALDDLYHVSLKLLDKTGNISNHEEIIKYIIPWFVYDRTQADIDYAILLKEKGWENLSQEEKAAWSKGLKGCLNTLDLKRIENAIYVIGKMLGIEIDSLKDNLPEIPTETYFIHLLENLNELYLTGYVYSITPEIPTLPINTYQKINDIERILYDIYQRLNSEYDYYCGEEIYCGEETGLLL